MERLIIKITFLYDHNKTPGNATASKSILKAQIFLIKQISFPFAEALGNRE